MSIFIEAIVTTRTVYECCNSSSEEDALDSVEEIIEQGSWIPMIDKSEETITNVILTVQND